MNTNKLKIFSKKARLILLEGVKQRVAYWGFDSKGNVKEEVTPIEGGYIFRENVFNDPSLPRKWNALKAAIRRHSVEDIIEEAAYTWFNRLLAIKILEKNNYIDCVYEYVSSDLKEPLILMRARKGDVGKLSEEERKMLNQYILESNDEEAFELLLTSFCRNQKLLNRIFGHIDDYTELLLPNNLLTGGGIVEHINKTDSIEEMDYREVELIGWLYQYYIADKKDEVFEGFKNKQKARAEDIPAATQIFTPKWIVRYMLENTVGRIWLDLHPDDKLNNKLKYLVTQKGRANGLGEPFIKNITELTIMDPACGSGHILVEGFDLLLKMYQEEGYTTKNSVINIIRNNIFGLDIDDRAAQLANFALLIKAAKYYPEILSLDIDTNIYSFPEPKEFSAIDVGLFLGTKDKLYSLELKEHLDLLTQGKNLGSILKISLSKELSELIFNRYKYYQDKYNEDELDIAEKIFWINIRRYIVVLKILNDRYAVVVANPPYMGTKNMNNNMRKYCEDHYSTGKYDLFSSFMLKSLDLCKRKGKAGLITQHSWLSTKQFDDLRKYFLNKVKLESVLHLGVGTFGIDFGTCSFVYENNSDIKNIPIFINLTEPATSIQKKELFEENMPKNIYDIYTQESYLKLPTYILAYRISQNVFHLLKKKKSLTELLVTREGLTTGDNDKFMRNWFEIDKVRINDKWFVYIKGGDYRKWYGNLDYIVNWENDGEAIKNNTTETGRVRSHNYNEDFIFKEGITWSAFSSKSPSFRIVPKGCLFDSKGSMAFLFESGKLEEILGYLNSKVGEYFLSFIAGTRDTKPGHVSMIPYVECTKEIEGSIKSIVSELCQISKEEWNCKEVSMEFQKNPLILKQNSELQNAFNSYCEEWEIKYYNFYHSEVKLNKIFIELYGLQSELIPDVSFKDITILQEEAFVNDKNELVFNKDEIVKNLISYSVGCMMGRYSLDRGGLIITNKEYKLEQFKNENPNAKYLPDEDGIIPLMGNQSYFSDDICIKFKQFLEVTLSTEALTENLNFVQDCLGMDLQKYLTEKFWLNHCKMYQKRPIYWLFSSPQGAFKALVYMHRINKFTVQKIRNNYLLKHISYLRNEIDKLEKDENNLSKSEAKRLDKFRSDEIECREYEKLVKDYADKQIEIDLDDGVSINYQKFARILASIK